MINLNGIGCKCIASAYFVSMQTNGSPGGWPFEGQYYCDANGPLTSGTW